MRIAEESDEEMIAIAAAVVPLLKRLHGCNVRVRL
jgi:hypothetical protein